MGAISGLIQLILYATYYKTTKWNEDNGGNQNPQDVENPPNIELPNVSAAGAGAANQNPLDVENPSNTELPNASAAGAGAANRVQSSS